MDIKANVYKQIRDEIIHGKLMPGERLPETQLSKRFGCSRAPVREAINQLEREGFLFRVENQGAAVNKSSPEEIIDYYTLLEVLESKAVEWATNRLTTQDIDHLVDMNNTMKKISTNDKQYVEKWAFSNVSFHRFFSENCGNQKMVWLIGEIRLRITRFRYLSFMITSFNDYIRDHEIIIEALRERNPASAGEAMKEHIARAKKLLMNHFFYMPVA